jgi:PAS domain S-box-containing protein
MQGKGTTIQSKLMRMVMLICGTVLLLTSGAYFVYEYVTYKELARQEIVSIARIISSNCTASLAFNDQEDAKEILSALKAQKSIRAAVLYNAEGKLFCTYMGEKGADGLPSYVGQDGYRFTAGFLEGFEPVVQNEKRVGTLFLRSDMQAMYDRFVLYGIIVVCFIAVSFLFVYLLSRQMQRSIADPILKLAAAARIISNKKDYSVRVAENNANDEVNELTRAFNQMLGQIDEQNHEIHQLNANLEEKIRQRTQELQNANQALTEQNEFIQTLIDSSVDLIAVFDEQLNYIAINKQAASVFKKAKEEVLNRNILEVFPSLKDKPIIGQLEKALNGEFLHVHAYQSQVSNHYLENFFVPLQNKFGEVDRVMLIGHDITELVEANEKLKLANAQLEKSNQDLEQFAYVASHDLQEPLRKIRTFSDLSEQNINNPEIQKRYLSKISTSAARMSELIQAVLNYSRLSRREEKTEDVSLSQIISQITVDLELAIEEKQATLVVEGLPVLKGNALQLHQLFFNLFTNALKFCNRRPEISIQSCLVPPQLRAEKGLPDEHQWIEISFADNGIGFEQKYASQLFSIFKRLHNANEYAGTGIGLALCKKIVEHHGGLIRVESVRDQGTRFLIYFPASLMKSSVSKQTDQAIELQ